MTMRHAYPNCPDGRCQLGTPRPGARFPKVRLRPAGSWRSALRAILGPATRLHRLRNLRSAMFYDAIDRLDRDLDERH